MKERAHVFPADSVQGPGVDKLVERECEAYSYILPKPTVRISIPSHLQVRLTKIANPLARMLNGRISRV